MLEQGLVFTRRAQRSSFTRRMRLLHPWWTEYSAGTGMARNYEKRFTGLNRFLEAKQKESDKAEIHRPPLHKLETAEEVKKWIPSIRKEIDYCLQQLGGVESRNYPDYKVKEFQKRVDQLEREHRRHVEKVHALDPETRGTIPWQPRPYARKRSHDTRVTVQGADGPQPKKLCSPLLEQEKLTAATTKTEKATTVTTCSAHETTSTSQLETKPQPPGSSPSPAAPPNTIPPSRQQTLPGLDYSSSDSEEES